MAIVKPVLPTNAGAGYRRIEVGLQVLKTVV